LEIVIMLFALDIATLEIWLAGILAAKCPEYGVEMAGRLWCQYPRVAACESVNSVHVGGVPDA
jgi:hypothetical protein